MLQTMQQRQVMLEHLAVLPRQRHSLKLAMNKIQTKIVPTLFRTTGRTAARMRLEVIQAMEILMGLYRT